MKVLQVIEALTLGGAERLVVELAHEYHRRGLDSKVLCLSQPGPWAAPLEAAGLFAGCIGKHRGVDFHALAALRRRIRELAPDIVHSHLFTANLWTRLASLPSKKHGLVITVHIVDSLPTPVHYLADRLLAPVADRYVAVSAAVHDHYTAHGIPLQRLRTIPNGIKWDGIESVEPFTRPVPLIRACGRLVPQKGFEQLIRAAAILAKRGRDFTIEIIGEGPERARLTQQIETAGVVDRVKLLGSRDDSRRLIAECDVFVLPSRKEGLPLVILEAMHAGRPIVASNLSCLSGVLSDDKEAVLVEVDSPEALAAALARMFADPSAAKAMGRLAQTRARADFSIERAASSYIEVYDEILGGRKR